MDKKEDFIYYISENSDFLEHLEKHNSLIYDLFYPIIEVLKNINEENSNELTKSEINSLFDEGYYYIYSTLENIKLLLKDKYNNDVHELIEDEKHLYYLIRFDDLDSLLNSKNEIVERKANDLFNKLGKNMYLDYLEEKELSQILEDAYQKEETLSIQDRFVNVMSLLGYELI